MYVHPAFRIEYAQAVAMFKEHAFGTLIITDAAGRPSAAHLPFLTEERPDGGLRIEFHVAKSNRIHELIKLGGQPALLTCQGPDASYHRIGMECRTKSRPGPTPPSTSAAW